MISEPQFEQIMALLTTIRRDAEARELARRDAFVAVVWVISGIDKDALPAIIQQLQEYVGMRCHDGAPPAHREEMERILDALAPLH